MNKEIGRYKIYPIFPNEKLTEVVVYSSDHKTFTDNNDNELTEQQLCEWTSLSSNTSVSSKGVYTIKPNPRVSFHSVFENQDISYNEINEKHFICIKHIEQGILLETDYIGYGDTVNEALNSCIELEGHLRDIHKDIMNRRKTVYDIQSKLFNIQKILSRYEYEEEDWETSSAYLDPIISIKGGCETIMDALIVNALNERGVKEVESLSPSIDAFRMIKKVDDTIIAFETGQQKGELFIPYDDNDPRYLYVTLDIKSERCHLRTNIHEIGELNFEPVSYLYTALSTMADHWLTFKHQDTLIYCCDKEEIEI